MKDTGNVRISGLGPQSGREGGEGRGAVVTKLLIIMLSQLTRQDTKLLKEFGDNSGASLRRHSQQSRVKTIYFTLGSTSGLQG